MGEELECQRCEYEWEYGGSRHYATCPNCHTSVSVGRFDDGGSGENGSISEQEFSELTERVDELGGEVQKAFEEIVELQERLSEVADRSAVDGAVSEQQIGELYEAVGGVVEQLGGSVEFDHAPSDGGPAADGIYDPTEDMK